MEKIMKTIKVQKLTKEAFAPYGAYYDMANPTGHALCGELHSFFPDRLTAYHDAQVAFSPILVKKPDVLKITQVEYHTTTSEIIMPLNDDMILHVAEPSAGTPITDQTKAFLVPKNTIIKMNACVWHLAPLPANESVLTAMIVLPECTYINDCKVVDLKEDEYFIIEK